MSRPRTAGPQAEEVEVQKRKWCFSVLLSNDPPLNPLQLSTHGSVGQGDACMLQLNPSPISRDGAPPYSTMIQFIPYIRKTKSRKLTTYFIGVLMRQILSCHVDKSGNGYSAIFAIISRISKNLTSWLHYRQNTDSKCYTCIIISFFFKKFPPR